MRCCLGAGQARALAFLLGWVTWLHGGVLLAAEPLSPAALVANRSGTALYVAGATGQRVLRLDPATRSVVATIPMPAPPSGLALSADDSRLFVTCAAPQSTVCVVDTATDRVVTSWPAGHTAMAPVPGPDGRMLYVCLRFNDAISFLDLASGKELKRVQVRREPVAAALTRDGRHLLVVNHLHHGRADADHVGAVVSVVDTTRGEVVKELALPNGSGVLQDVRVSPDGRYAVVTHILARHQLPTTQLERGWMNTNAATLIDLERMEIIDTVLLDSPERGAANPWGAAWSADGTTLMIAHAGTHELSVIDFPGVLERLKARAGDPAAGRTEVPNDLAFLVGLRRRIALPAGDRGPRAVAVVGCRAFVANYFSDTLAVVDVADAAARWESTPLGPKPEPDLVRQGEFYFHDASICFQGWQSCASCHPGDGRVDALNWDLLNDGFGNPKNNKSMLLSHRTPPAMSRAIRDTAEVAVRAGLRHILFTVQPEAVPLAMDEYLKALRPVPSPQLVNGELSPAARRGERVFDRAGCAACHPGPLFTDLQPYDVGTGGGADGAGTAFDTPTLVELWRTAPYLHDGSAVTVREALTTRNPDGKHGPTSTLSAEELNDLCAYLLSL